MAFVILFTASNCVGRCFLLDNVLCKALGSLVKRGPERHLAVAHVPCGSNWPERQDRQMIGQSHTQSPNPLQTGRSGSGGGHETIFSLRLSAVVRIDSMIGYYPPAPTPTPSPTLLHTPPHPDTETTIAIGSARHSAFLSAANQLEGPTATTAAL